MDKEYRNNYGTSYSNETSQAQLQNIIYQPVQLDKEYIEIENNDSKKFKQANGIKPIHPSQSYQASFFNKMKNMLADYRCEYLICVTFYNEGKQELDQTLTCIQSNLSAFQVNQIDYKKIACVVVADGIQPFMQSYERDKSYFSQFFNPQEIYDKYQINDINKLASEDDNEEFAHLYIREYQPDANFPPIQLIFCIKQLNQRKLNSHLWFFGGFCKVLHPRFVQLLDVGTQPLNNALWYLYEAMATDKQCAGVCGEIIPSRSSWKSIVQNAQLVEYKFAHIFDKPLEHLFGFITVLPGAFSAYRWSALQGDPLWREYFRYFTNPEEMNAYWSNIFLAEDRVLSLALVSKIGQKYNLKYIKRSQAITDSPDTLYQLLVQRRRWINGSWFALLDSLRKFRKIRKSNHSCCRKCCIYVEMLYLAINVIFYFLMIGLFFLTFSVLLRTTFPDQTEDEDLFDVGNALIIMYFTCLLLTFILSLSAKPKLANEIYWIISILLGVFMFAILALMGNYLSQMDSDYQLNLLFGLFPMLGFVIGIILYNSVLTILKGCIQYIIMIPTYANIFLIYAMCQIHDCTWGNRPGELTEQEKKKTDQFEFYRAKWVIVWVLLNSVFVYFLSKFEKNYEQGVNLLVSIAAFLTFVFFIRFVGMILYLFTSVCGYTQYKKEKHGNRTDEEELLDKSLEHLKNQNKIIEPESF